MILVRVDKEKMFMKVLIHKTSYGPWLLGTLSLRVRHFYLFTTRKMELSLTKLRFNREEHWIFNIGNTEVFALFCTSDFAVGKIAFFS